MGGCASRPKESDILDETPVQDNNGGESQIEKPSIDVSEPEKEAQGSSSEPEAAVVEQAVSSETVAETAKPTEDNVKATAAKDSEDKTTAPLATGVETEKSGAAASEEEVKKDAPVVSS